jgi:hypothetical protein
MSRKRDHRSDGADMEYFFRVALWFADLTDPPTVDRIREDWHVGRSAAYRYLRAWRCVNGIKSPLDECGGETE